MFISELEKELKNLKQGTIKGAKKWPLKNLLQLVVEVASIARSFEGTDPNWPVPTANLVAIYRSEDAKKTQIDNYIPPPETKGPLIKDSDGDD